MLRAGVSLITGFVFLLGLWMMYTSSPRLSELYVGFAVAALGVFGSCLIHASGFAGFRPRAGWIALAFLEPWYVLVGSYRLGASLVRALLHRRSRARFHAISFNAGTDDPESSARRTLTIAYLTIPPDSVVVGIDRHANELLLHEIQPSRLPLIARELGAEE
jgi:multisubunit Na+/H+ antiporter MnhE subunit